MKNSKRISMTVLMPVQLILDADADIKLIARGLHAIGLQMEFSVKKKVRKKKKGGGG